MCVYVCGGFREMLWGLKYPPPNFHHEQVRKLVEVVVQVQLHLFIGNERLKITRGIVNLIQELLVLAENLLK